MLLGPVPADGIANRPLVDPSVPGIVAGAPRDWREYHHRATLMLSAGLDETRKHSLTLQSPTR